MKFEHATKADVDIIMQILSDARSRIGRLGIDQWQYGYPTRDIIIEDVKLNRYYVVKDENGEICAVFAMLDEGEPTYDKIYDGKWLCEGKAYIAIHRIAVSAKNLKRGLASSVMSWAEKHASDIGYSSVRIDTHIGNTPMRAMLEKNEYTMCGTIYLEDGESRCAYEKLVRNA